MENFKTKGSESNISTYFDRMKTSLGDKVRLLEWIPSSSQKIIDIGCGTGEILSILQENGHNVLGIDSSNDSVKHAQKLQIPIQQDYAHNVNTIVNEYFGSKVDTIIASSVIHEIFSYGNNGNNIGKMENIEKAFLSFSESLVQGGKLLIRDGVSPGNWDAYMTVDNDDIVNKFLKDSPFAYLINQEVTTDRTIEIYSAPENHKKKGFLKRVNDTKANNLYYGNMSSLMEFAFTYNWGLESWEREVNEYYGVFTEKGLKFFAEKFGFKLIHSESYIQQGYIDGLKDKVSFYGPTLFPREFPATNAVWVFEKV